jgi:DNA-binding transcriptional MerR regulator
MEKKLVKIGEAAALIGSTPATLRKWEETGELLKELQTSADAIAEELGIDHVDCEQD